MICAIEMNVVLADQGLCLFDIRSFVNGEYQDDAPAEILGSQLRLHRKRRNESNTRFYTDLTLADSGFFISITIYYEIGFL